jgi:hypothetical protein
MPDIDPAYIDAIEEVVERRKDDAEWDPDSMRAALTDVAQGDSQTEASEERDFSQPILSKRWSEVEETAEDIIANREGGSRLFRDPMEEAIGDFEQFFEELNAKYDLGIHDRAIQMMVDEIRDAGQLPAPMYVEQFLRGTKSGVSGTDVEYVRRRYETWAQNQQVGGDSAQLPSTGMGGMGGQQIGGQQQQSMGMSGGFAPGGQQQQQPGMGQQRQPAQPPQQPEQSGSEDPRVDELQEQVQALEAAIGEMMEEDEPNQQMVTIVQEDGTEVTMPFEQAQAMGYLGQNDGPDFIEKLQQAKQAGLIPSEEDMQDDDGRDLEETLELLETMGVLGDDEEDDMAEAIQNAISELGQKQLQAQQQMGQNFQQVMEEMRSMEEENDEDITLEDVENVIEDKLTKSETEQLREEMDDRFQQMMETVEKRAAASEGGQQSTEFLKTDREMEFREKQLETLNENLKTLPTAVAKSVKEGLVPAMKEMQFAGDDTGNPLWSPPQQQGRGEPSYQPQEMAGEQEAQRAQQTRQQQSRQQQAQGGYPEPDSGQEPEQPDEGGSGAVEEPEGVTQEDAEDIRDKLNLSDSDDTQEVNA